MFAKVNKIIYNKLYDMREDAVFVLHMKYIFQYFKLIFVLIQNINYYNERGAS